MMLKKSHYTRRNTKNTPVGRQLRLEVCEDRRMLASMADIVFLMDESGSDQNTHTQNWVETVIDDLHSALAAAQIDVKYGLVGFVESTPAPGNGPRYAHTQLVGGELFTNDINDLIGGPATGGILSLKNVGGDEDGWDAFEHVIAEYNFRNNAVPIFVLIQNDEGRIDHVGADISSTTRAGVFAALKSKNVILNMVVVERMLALAA